MKMNRKNKNLLKISIKNRLRRAKVVNKSICPETIEFIKAVTARAVMDFKNRNKPKFIYPILKIKIDDSKMEEFKKSWQESMRNAFLIPVSDEPKMEFIKLPKMRKKKKN